MYQCTDSINTHRRTPSQLPLCCTVLCCAVIRPPCLHDIQNAESVIPWYGTSTLLYSTPLYSTPLCYTVLYSTELYSTPLCFTVLYFALLDSTLLCYTLLCSTVLRRSNPCNDLPCYLTDMVLYQLFYIVIAFDSIVIARQQEYCVAVLYYIVLYYVVL